jgi:hypothetical protein
MSEELSRPEGQAPAAPPSGVQADDALDSFNANSVAWAVSRWQDEVMNRPLVNVHRRTLDGTWRQVIRYFGGDPDKRIGPSHDTLLMREQEARAWKPPAAAPPVAPAPAREGVPERILVFQAFDAAAQSIHNAELRDNVREFLMGAWHRNVLPALKAPAEPPALEAAQAFDADWLFKHCRIVYFPAGGAYPIEHNPHALGYDKTGEGFKSHVRAALRAQSAAVEAAPMVKE